MFVCEVPLRSGLTRLIDLQTSKPTAWRVASDHVLIQTYTSSASPHRTPSVERVRALVDHDRAQLTSIWITPALTERRERFEFASGVDGKIGDSRPSAERTNPDARCRFGSTHCYPSTDDFALYILASLPNEVEFVRVWSGFSAVMSEFGWCGQAIRWAFRSAYLCLLPPLRHERS